MNLNDLNFTRIIIKIVQFNNFSGAMETWGLVTYRETNLLYDPTVSSTANKQRIAAVIGHEFAHMW